MKNKIKRHAKKPAIISAILAVLMTIYAFSYYFSTEPNFFLALFFSIFVFIVSFIYFFILVGFAWAVIFAIRYIKRRNKIPFTNLQTKTSLEDVKSLPALSFPGNGDIKKEQISPVNIPTYKDSISYDHNQTDSSEECLIEKVPFVQPNAKRLKSIKTYIVLDTETTGLSCKHDKIIEISLARYTNGDRTDCYTTLINPRRHIPDEATAINRIRDEDVLDAPTFADAWPQISRFFDGAVIVGHNVTFDLNMIGYNMPRKAQPLEVSYLDTVRLAKAAFPEQPNYKLETLVENLGISNNQEHRADSDVDLTDKLFKLCRDTIIDKYEQDLKERREQKVKEKAARQANYGWSPLLDKNFVFTGEFQHDREKLQNVLQAVGANLRTEINTKTSYLVYGNLKNLPQWALERKYEKAKKMIENGAQIIVLSEEEYLVLLKSTIDKAPVQ